MDQLKTRGEGQTHPNGCAALLHRLLCIFHLRHWSLGLTCNSVRAFRFICIKQWELPLRFHLEEMTIWGEDSDSAIVARHLDKLCKAR